MPMPPAIPVQTTLRLLDARDEWRVQNQEAVTPDLVAHLQAVSAEQGLPLTVTEAEQIVAQAEHPSVPVVCFPPVWERPGSQAEWIQARETAAAAIDVATQGLDQFWYREKWLRIMIWSLVMPAGVLLTMRFFWTLPPKGHPLDLFDKVYVGIMSLTVGGVVGILVTAVLESWLPDCLWGKARAALRKTKDTQVQYKTGLTEGFQPSVTQIRKWLQVPGLAAPLYAIHRSGVPFLNQDLAQIEGWVSAYEAAQAPQKALKDAQHKAALKIHQRQEISQLLDGAMQVTR